MQFTYDINSDSVEQAIDAFEGQLEDSSPAPRVVADDFREVLAALRPGEGAEKESLVLGPRELGGLTKA